MAFREFLTRCRISLKIGFHRPPNYEANNVRKLTKLITHYLHPPPIKDKIAYRYMYMYMLKVGTFSCPVKKVTPKYGRSVNKLTLPKTFLFREFTSQGFGTCINEIAFLLQTTKLHSLIERSRISILAFMCQGVSKQGSIVVVAVTFGRLGLFKDLTPLQTSWGTKKQENCGSTKGRAKTIFSAFS